MGLRAQLCLWSREVPAVLTLHQPLHYGLRALRPRPVPSHVPPVNPTKPPLPLPSPQLRTTTCHPRTRSSSRLRTRLSLKHSAPTSHKTPRLQTPTLHASTTHTTSPSPTSTSHTAKTQKTISGPSSSNHTRTRTTKAQHSHSKSLTKSISPPYFPINMLPHRQHTPSPPHSNSCATYSLLVSQRRLL